MELQLLAEGSRGLAGKADNGKTVGAVGGYLKFDNVVVSAYDGPYIIAGLHAVLVQDEDAVGDAVGEFRLLCAQVIESAYACGLGVVCNHVALVDVLAIGLHIYS